MLFEKIQMHYGICIFTIWPARLRCTSYPPLGTSYPAWREGVGAESEACAVMLQGVDGVFASTPFFREKVAKVCPYGIITTNRKSPVESRVLRFSVWFFILFQTEKSH